jgi:hypothetical protein
VACIITAFVHNHYYLKSAASSIYSAMKNKGQGDEHPVKEAAMSGAGDTLNTAAMNAMASRMGGKFAEIAHESSGVSLSWVREIGRETGKSMLEQGSRAVFDWGSKAVF